jgi:hypothetical protein
MNIPMIEAIALSFVTACISQWWLRMLYAPVVAFAILAAVAEAKSWKSLEGGENQ